MVDDLLRVMVDDDARQWVAYILGMQDKEKYLDKIEALRNSDPEVYFAVTVLWKIIKAGFITWRILKCLYHLWKHYIRHNLGGLCWRFIELLLKLPPESVDLVITSPPFALQREKEYGNEKQDDYVDWLLQFAQPVKRVLKQTGSFVLDLGGAYVSGRPVRSLYNYKVLLQLCSGHGFNLAEEFFWHNPAKLPSPIEWVKKRKIRVKDSVNTIWCLSKMFRRQMWPVFSKNEKLLKQHYRANDHRSHDISKKFVSNNAGNTIESFADF